jgi:ketosteroid isomerase-like protein
MHSAGEDLARQFWMAMGTNDFSSLLPLLSDDFELSYPQSGERFDAANMVRLNQEYPSETRHWTFVINELIGGDERAVTDVTVTDGVVRETVLSFFTTQAGRIQSMVEYWPQPFEAPAARAHLRSNN